MTVTEPVTLSRRNFVIFSFTDVDFIRYSSSVTYDQPQLVDHAHTDSCIVIGCNVVQPRRENEHVYLWSQSHRSWITVAVAIVNTKSSHDVA